MKTYVLTVSRTFPSTHKRKGEETFFVQKIKKALRIYEFYEHENIIDKIHTIRVNYDLWAKRIKEVQEGKAILSLRYWLEKPYNSKQVEICQINKDSGCGVQKLEFDPKEILNPFIEDVYVANVSFVAKSVLAKNDGLSLEDFKEWFRKADLSKPMAIIHFTPFRYQ